MKTILALLTTLALAALALATETADMVPGGAPASRCAIGTESGTTWTGNDASNPIYCSLTSGGFSSSGLATAANQTTTNTSIGATNDTAASTDTGTFSLIALTKRIATHLTRVWQGPQASCAHYRGTTTSVSAGSSGTSIDAGATGTVYWLAASNLSRTYDIQISADTGTFRVPPSGSVTLSNPGAATADSITVATNCTGCGGAATNVTVLACDDD